MFRCFLEAHVVAAVASNAVTNAGPPPRAATFSKCVVFLSITSAEGPLHDRNAYLTADFLLDNPAE